MAGRHARHGRRRRGRIRVVLGVALALAVLLGGAAYAAHRYDRATADRILPGVRVEGVDLGGMTQAQALAALEEAVEDRLDREIEVRVEDETWHVSPADLGTTAELEGPIAEALAVSQDLSWPTRVFHRLFDKDLDRAISVEYRQDPSRVERFVDVVAEAVFVSPVNAAITVEDGEVEVQEPENGLALRRKAAVEAVAGAIAGGGDVAELALRETDPKVTGKKLGHTIVIRLSRNKLQLYKGLKLKKTYPVATGSPGYPTPQGEWTVVDKRENPTWINPAPDGWGAGLPRSIGPGPGNPLGTRALYLDAPGIRIHGTYALSSIGTYASHGCIRMSIADVEELYEIVDVKTPVHIIW